MKLSEKLDRIKAATPHVSQYGQLYKHKADLRRKWSRVTLYTLFVSDEATHLLRNHVFQSTRPKSARDWDAWFRTLVNPDDGHVHGDSTDNMTRLSFIQSRSVLPGLALRTSKSWAVQRIIGWVGGAKSQSHNSRMVKRRNKSKSKGRARG